MEELNASFMDLSCGKLTNENLKEIIDTLKETKLITELNLSHYDNLYQFGTELASAIRQNKSLTTVNLSHSIFDVELASALYEHKTITHLDLSYAKISHVSFKKIVKKMNLEYLNLRSTFSQLNTSELNELDLKNTSNEEPFSGDFEELFTSVIELLLETTTLKYLNLSQNQLIYNYAQKLFNALLINRSVTEFSFADNCIGLQSLPEFKEMLKHNTSLLRMDLSNNLLDNTAFEEIIMGLAHNKTLTDLNLSQNNIGPSLGSNRLAGILLKNGHLTILNLHSSRFHSVAIYSLVTRSKHYSKVQNAFREEMGLSVIKDLKLALKPNTTFSSLCLRVNGRYEEDQNFLTITIKEIIIPLMTYKFVTHLDLSFYLMDAEDAKCIAEFLKQDNTLTNLDLSYNNIGAEGAEYIAAALLINKSLLTLLLVDNKIDTQGTKALWKALKENRTLVELDISIHPIEYSVDIGLNELIDVLRCNPILNTVNVIGYYRCESIDEDLIAAIKENTTMLDFQVYRPDSHKPSYKPLKFYLQRNRTLLRKVAFVGKYVYTHRTEEEQILKHISKKEFEEFEAYQGRSAVIKSLSQSDFSISEAEQVIDYTHCFIKNHFFEIAGIHDTFYKLPSITLSYISSFLKLKDIH